MYGNYVYVPGSLSQYALIEELRGFLKRCSGMDQVAAHSTCAPPHCPAAADPPSRAGDAEGGPSCLAKRSRRDDPAEEASVQHPVPHVHAVVAETGDQDKRAEVPVRVRGRERERPHVVPGKCPECAEAGFGLMVSEFNTAATVCSSILRFACAVVL